MSLPPAPRFRPEGAHEPGPADHRHPGRGRPALSGPAPRPGAGVGLAGRQRRRHLLAAAGPAHPLQRLHPAHHHPGADPAQLVPHPAGQPPTHPPHPRRPPDPAGHRRPRPPPLPQPLPARRLPPHPLAPAQPPARGPGPAGRRRAHRRAGAAAAKAPPMVGPHRPHHPHRRPLHPPQDRTAGHPGQRLVARPHWPGHQPGQGHRPELARLLLRRLSPHPHRPRPANGPPARTLPARIRYLRHLLSQLRGRPHRPCRTFCGRFSRLASDGTLGWG